MSGLSAKTCVLLMIPVHPRVRAAGRRYERLRADVACGRRRRNRTSWLALMSIRSGRYVPFSENPPGQPVALECPERPRGSVRPAAEFVRQFCFRRQPGPRRVFAASDPPREHGVKVQVGPRVLPRIIHDQPHGQCNGSSPGDCSCSIWNSRTRPHLQWFTAVTTSLGRRHERALVAVAGVARRMVW
jgi:hypothetical protein